MRNMRHEASRNGKLDEYSSRRLYRANCGTIVLGASTGTSVINDELNQIPVLCQYNLMDINAVLILIIECSN
jgi:hypothetical protein